MDLSAYKRPIMWVRHSRPRHYLSVLFWIGFLLSLIMVFTVNLGIVPVFLSAFLLIFALRTGAASGVQLLAMHPDVPPVLFLRSFAADETRYTRPSDDQILSSALRPLGPNITFGDPGRFLAHLGPGRIHTGYRDDWMEGVNEYIGKSQLVTLKVGDTPGVLDEARRLLKSAEPTRILFYFSIYLKRKELHELYQTFSMAISDQLQHPLPGVDELENHRVIRFDETGKPELLANIKSPFIWWRFLIGPAAHPLISVYLKYRVRLALRPVFVRLGHTSFDRSLFTLPVAMLAAFFGGTVALGFVLMWNGIRVKPKRMPHIILGVVLAGLPFVHPYIAEIISILAGNLVLSLAVLALWPKLWAPLSAGHSELGGRFYGVIASLVVVFVLAMVNATALTSKQVEVTADHYAHIVDAGDFPSLIPPGSGHKMQTMSVTEHLLRNNRILYEFESQDGYIILRSDYEQFQLTPGFLATMVNRGIGNGFWSHEAKEFKRLPTNGNGWLLENIEGVPVGSQYELLTERDHLRVEILGIVFESELNEADIREIAGG